MSTYNGNPRLGPPAERPRRVPSPDRTSTGFTSRCTMLGNPQIADPFDREVDAASPRAWRPIPNCGLIQRDSRHRPVWTLLPGATPHRIDRDLLDDPSNRAPARVWQGSPAGVPSPVNALLEAAIRASNPWASWRTCTEVDPPDLCGRRVLPHLTDDQRSGGDYDR